MNEWMNEWMNGLKELNEIQNLKVVNPINLQTIPNIMKFGMAEESTLIMYMESHWCGL